MKKSVKIAMLIASILCAAGVVLCAVGLFAFHFDFSQLNVYPIETNFHEVEEKFENISIEIRTADVVFALSENGECRVVCEETEKIKHSVTVVDDTLVIKVEDSRKWYDYIGFFFGRTLVTVYLPQTDYRALSIKTDTGDVEMPSGFVFEEGCVETDTGDIMWRAQVAKDLNITVDTGDICFDSAGAENIRVESNTGDVEFHDTVATESIFVETDTGDVNFDRSDAASIFVETDTGDVEGTLLSEKVFFTETDTGDIDVPRGTTGGRCEIRTDTGDIEIGIVR